MSKSASPILPLPKKKRIAKRNIPHVDRDHRRGWDVAGPLFKAGATSISLAEWPKYKGGRHLPTQHRLGLIVQGKMQFRCGTKTFTAKPGDLCFTPAGTTLTRTAQGPIVWLYIELEDIPMWAPLKEIGPSVRKYESADLMYILARQIVGALRSQDVYSIHCARESAHSMVDLLKRELRQSSNSWNSKRMDSFVKVLDRIRARPDLQWERHTIARELKMSERTLTREFKRIFNMAPSKMVANIRMDLASRLLIETDRSLADIAHFVGYDSPFSFSRLFKKYVGVSPQHYRTMPAADRQKPTLGE
jgi:AraC-like DNA-binding protein